MPGLELLATTSIYNFFLVFVRVGAALMLLPGLGEMAIPARIRLIVGLVLALALMPIVSMNTGGVPEQPADMVLEIFVELVAGAFIGTTTRIIFAAAQVAGQIIGQSIGLAMIFSTPNTGFEGGSVMATALVMGGIAIIFLADLHYLMIEAIVRSYIILPSATLPNWSDLSEVTTEVVSRSFLVGVQFSAPFLIISFLFNVGLGLTNRMMAALPVFFIGMPFLLAGGVFLVFVTIEAILLGLASEMANWLRTLEV
ncbi:flagellar biosynthetic protein FliR [Rhodospirillaceae bacterium SYSU D60014]|uniref:flagellar biosynthetic protein FliR n=1 Tax=Virgifigura deserti TaxID=2268457 RepID=UPI000E676667